jgi:CPA2 family monovalent cation:H+ antiporter-2
MPHVAFLGDLLIILLAAVCVVAIFRRLSLSPVLGYFVAGSIIGTHGLGVVNPSDIAVFAEFGVVFLLFAIGLELTFDRLKSMRVHVFGFGTLQVVITSGVLAAALLPFGFDHKAVIVLGGGLAFSSTAIVMQVLAEARSQSTQVGRLALSTLILQDFAVVPMLVMIPLLAQDNGMILLAVTGAFGKAMIALVLILVFGRLLLRPLFRMIASDNMARSNELFVATTLLIALGAAWTTENLGLSLALGAFVAGVLVAETEFQHQAEESIAPFKGLLLGLFFMTVGMEINFRMILENFLNLLGWSLALIVVKASIIVVLCLLFRFSLGAAIHAGLLLAQGGEFAFVLVRLAAERGLLQADLAERLMLVVTMTMALTPLLSIIGQMIAQRLDKKARTDPRAVDKDIADMHNHVIIGGFGRVGKMVARLLEAEHVRYIAVDIDADKVETAREEGFPIYRGDSSHMEMLNRLGIHRATAVILTLDNEVTLRKAIRHIHQRYPSLPVILRVEDLSHLESFQESSEGGVLIAVPETYETGLQLGGAVLKTVGISEFEISRIKNQFRAGNYVLAQRIDEEEDEEAEDEDVRRIAPSLH